MLHTQMQQLLAHAHEVVNRMVTRLQFQFEQTATKTVQNDSIHEQFPHFISYSVDRKKVEIQNVSLQSKTDGMISVSEIVRATIAFNDDLSQPPHLLLRIDDRLPLLEYKQLVSIECHQKRATILDPAETYKFDQFIGAITTAADSAAAKIEKRADYYDVPGTQTVSALRLEENQATLIITKFINRHTTHTFTLTFSA